LIGLPLTESSLKTEPDGRMFPITDNSETIVDCLTKAASLSEVEIRTGQLLKEFRGNPAEFEISLKSGEIFSVLVYSSPPAAAKWVIKLQKL